MTGAQLADALNTVGNFASMFPNTQFGGLAGMCKCLGRLVSWLECQAAVVWAEWFFGCQLCFLQDWARMIRTTKQTRTTRQLRTHLVSLAAAMLETSLCLNACNACTACKLDTDEWVILEHVCSQMCQLWRLRPLRNLWMSMVPLQKLHQLQLQMR